jgi:hypothetical protein
MTKLHRNLNLSYAHTLLRWTLPNSIIFVIPILKPLHKSHTSLLRVFEVEAFKYDAGQAINTCLYYSHTPITRSCFMSIIHFV